MSESENILQTVKTTLQDFVAPDVRENKVQIAALREELRIRLDALETKNKAEFDVVKAQLQAIEQKTAARFEAAERTNAAKFEAIDARFNAIDSRFEHLESRMDSQFQAILAAIGQSKAENEAYIIRQLSALSERVAALEATHH